MNPLNELSLAWQVWGYGLLGAIVFMLIVFLVAQWSAIVALFADLFTDAPMDADAAFVAPCGREFVAPDPHEPIRSVEADEILLASRDGIALVTPRRKAAR